MDNRDASWQPSANIDVLKARAEMLTQIRHFFAQRQVLEVETPILSHAGTTDPNIESFRTEYFPPGTPQISGQGQTCYLATSPEFHMKRLLAAGSGAIYQVSRVFRNQEQGSNHNPEFSLLEWYRPDFDLKGLMDEVAELVKQLMSSHLTMKVAPEFYSYREIYQRLLSIDPLKDSNQAIIDCVYENGIEVHGLDPEDRDAWLDVLMSHCIQPQLGSQSGQPCLTFIYHYPESQAALAQVLDGDPPVAERFELFILGTELANGYHELQAPDEQMARFQHDQQVRFSRRQPSVTYDEYLIAALHVGLPDCSGVALGLDRLIQLAVGAEDLQHCLAFPFPYA